MHVGVCNSNPNNAMAQLATCMLCVVYTALVTPFPSEREYVTPCYLHKVCNLSLNSHKNKYLILATPLLQNTVISYTCIDEWECTDVWGSIQMNGGGIDVWGCMDVWGPKRHVGCTGVI